MKPDAAIVREAEAEERQLIERAKSALEKSNWEIGRCAQQWTELYGKGRTDADFAEMIGSSQATVNFCRRVAERFYSSRSKLPSLSWRHFKESIAWEDADACLQWANENEASYREMSAWRKAKNGTLDEPETLIDDGGEADTNGSGTPAAEPPPSSNSAPDGGGADSALDETPPPSPEKQADPETQTEPQKPKSVDAILKSIEKTVDLIANTFDATGLKKTATKLRKLADRLDPAKKLRPKKFNPPTVGEVEQYCNARENKVDAQGFVDFYESKGWKVGNQPMKDWQAAVRTWEKREGANDGSKYRNSDFAREGVVSESDRGKF